MSVSTVTTFNLNATEIVNAAYRKIAVVADNMTATSTQITNGIQALNVMIKAFITKGMPLWEVVEYSITPTATRNYNIGVGLTVNTPAPLKIFQAVLLDNTNLTNRPLEVRSHYDYNLLSNSATSGAPTVYMYEPGNQSGVFHIWPTPDSYTQTNCSIKIVYQKPFADIVTAATDNVDFPQWWLEAIIYGLADRMAPEFGVPIQDRQLLKMEAKEKLDEALSFGTEEGSLFIEPDWTRRN